MGSENSGRRSFRNSLTFSGLKTSQSSERPNPIASSQNQRIFGNESRTSFLSASSGPYTKVELVELADSESSRDDISAEAQSERDAESIYSIIQEYSDQRFTFRFSESFHDEDPSVSHPTFPNKTAESPRRGSPKREEESPKQATNTSNQILVSPVELKPGKGSPSILGTFGTQDASVSHTAPPDRSADSGSSGEYADARSFVTRPPDREGHPSPSAYVQESAFPRPSSGCSASLSSGELLLQLATRNATLSERTVSDPYPIPDPYTSPRTLASDSGYNPGSLSAGIDSNSELPITLYTVQDHTSPSSRWSVYEAQAKRTGPLNTPKPVYVPMREGRAARRISVSTGSGRYSIPVSLGSSAPAHNPTSAVPPHSPRPPTVEPAHNSMLAPETAELSQNVAQNQTQPLPTDVSTDSIDLVSLPSSMVRESEEHRHQHQDMWGGQPESIFANEHGSFFSHEKSHGQMSEKFGLEASQNLASYYSWTRWAFVMFTALLAVPVFFLLALGVFDNGGFARSGFAKNGCSARYQKRYTPAQKTLSVILGMFWIAVVFSMIAVGFGVGLRS